MAAPDLEAWRCPRCAAELPPGTKHCPACWAPDPQRCPSDEEERIWKRLAALSAASLMLVVTGLGLMLQVVPFFGAALRIPLWPGLTVDEAIPPAGAFLFALGLGFGALCKGRSVLWGFLGLLCFIGFIPLHFMDKICRYCRLRGSHRDRRCLRCGAPM
jgi:hypothetical protein